VQLIQQSQASSHAELYVAGYADDGLPGSVGERMEGRVADFEAHWRLEKEARQYAEPRGRHPGWTRAFSIPIESERRLYFFV
jgi:hypothetical protein